MARGSDIVGRTLLMDPNPQRPINSANMYKLEKFSHINKGQTQVHIYLRELVQFTPKRVYVALPGAKVGEVGDELTCTA